MPATPPPASVGAAAPTNEHIDADIQLAGLNPMR